MKEIIYSFPGTESDYFFRITICGISYCDGSYQIDRPNSPVYTLEYIREGTGKVYLENGTVLTPKQGDVYFLPGGEHHRYASDAQNPWIKIWCNVSGQLVDQLVSLYHLNSIRLLPQCPIDAELTEFVALLADPTDSNARILEQAAVILHRIFQIMARQTQKQPKPVSGTAISLQEYLDRHIDQPITLEEMAQSVALSPSQTIRCFKEAFAITPYEYLLRRRIELAEQLLQNTRIPVKEIAYSLGFRDEHYFSTFFRKRTGVVPSQFRQQHKL